MQESTEQTSPIADLIHNGETARKLRETLRTNARRLSLADVQEIVDKLVASELQGNLAVQEGGESDLPAANRALEAIRLALEDARRCHSRKLEWDTKVVANARIITQNAARAAELHRELREHRRELRAREVEAMRTELAELEREAMAAWVVVRQFELPVDFEHRLFRSTETFTNALKDAEGTLSKKKPWEDAVAGNVAAVTVELDRLQAAVASRGPLPSEAAPPTDLEPALEASEGLPAPEGQVAAPARATDAEIIRQIRRIEDMLRNRRPIDRDEREALNTRLKSLVASAALEPPKPAAPQGPRLSREELEMGRLEVEAALSQCEAALGVKWPPPKPTLEARPAPPAAPPSPESEATPSDLKDGSPSEADGTDAAPPALEPDASAKEGTGQEEAAHEEAAHEEAAHEEAAHEEAAHEEAAHEEAAHEEAAHEEAAHEAASSGGPTSTGSAPFLEPLAEPIRLGAVKMVQAHLQRVRELLEAGKVPGALRKVCWARYRQVSEGLRARRGEARTQEVASFQQSVAEVTQFATEANPMKVRKRIQELQSAILESSLNKGERDQYLKALREAWAMASKHQLEMREAQKQRETEGLNRLGEHLQRWEGRKEGIERLLERLEVQLTEYKERQRTSTSIGYRVVAEQRMAELRNRIEELKGVRIDLEQKIGDVRPRLEGAGWQPSSKADASSPDPDTQPSDPSQA